MTELPHHLQSVCSTCLKPIPATITNDGNKIYLTKTCAEHGAERVLESNGREFYHTLQSKAPERKKSLQVIAQASDEPLGPSCVALIEITDACNLECPLCFASSGPHGKYFMSYSEFCTRIERLAERRGAIDVLMISGGEPTAHPELNRFLEYALNSPSIEHIMLNTNGLLLAQQGRVQDAVLRAWEKLELYLQFDSLRDSTVKALRGRPSLVEQKLATLEWTRERKVPVTFAVTLQPTVSPDELRELILLAVQQENIRGITFQPAFASGRHQLPFTPDQRLTTPDVVRRIIEAAPEMFTQESFINLPCSHPNCAIVSYFFRASGRLWPLCKDIDPAKSLEGRINFNLEDLKRCGCETTELGNYVRGAELSADNSFRLVVKPFMDRFNLNRDRTMQCCTHVVGPEGRVMSFCEYNVFREKLAWNRNQVA